MSYKITKKITKYNQMNSRLNAIGGIQHSTGNGEDTDESNNNWFNTGNRGANAHFFIDFDSITQDVETSMKAGHAREPANSKFWGSEMCETCNPNKFKEIWNRQVWLWAYLFTQVANPRILTISKDVLRSHKEENDINHKGDKNNHQDPHAYFAMFGKTMDDMRSDVQKAINDILFNESINKMVKKNIISNPPTYWVDNCKEGCLVKGEYVGSVFMKVTGKSSVKDSLDALSAKKIISTPYDYWLNNINNKQDVKGEYMRKVIIKINSMI